MSKPFVGIAKTSASQPSGDDNSASPIDVACTQEWEIAIMSNTEKLSDDRLKVIQDKLIEHVQSLNRAGTASDAKVSRDDVLRALGLTASDGGDAEAWLCGADGNCGVKS